MDSGKWCLELGLGRMRLRQTLVDGEVGKVVEDEDCQECGPASVPVIHGLIGMGSW